MTMDQDLQTLLHLLKNCLSHIFSDSQAAWRRQAAESECTRLVPEACKWASTALQMPEVQNDQRLVWFFVMSYKKHVQSIYWQADDSGKQHVLRVRVLASHGRDRLQSRHHDMRVSRALLQPTSYWMLVHTHKASM